jgi:hypothetical protein
MPARNHRFLAFLLPKAAKGIKKSFPPRSSAGVSARAAKSNKLAMLKQYLIFNAALRLALYPPA